ncbi:hypothetical protein Ahy_A08g040882 [Arachis hypogaea]|uniref:Aminotransferase-like plant mobile domain-containing protein n=1 Tax=Arachis hypogaea TaxID=3818 RepID=A0A445C0W6_ARAHY|nr:hypothetical protein Ahy_A08g040882 [Arachis hypogaea]
MSGGGVNAEENLNRLDEHHIAAHLFLKPTRVLTPYGTLVDVFMVPTGHVGTTKFNIKLKWLRTRLQQMSLDLEDNGLMQYTRCYILYLLGGVLLPDKANNTVHVQYLLLLADYDGICTYSWGSAVLCWLYRAMYLATEYSVEGMAGCHTLLISWIYYRLPFLAPNVTTPYSFPLATRWAGKKGQNDYAEQRLLRHRLRLDNLQVDEFVWQPYMDPRILSRVSAEFLGHPHGDFYTAVVPLIFFRWIEILNVDRVLRQFGGKQGPPNPPLNIDTFHRQSARNDDGWWPVRLSEWFEEVVPAGAPEEYGRGPVVNLPPVPRDHRRQRPRRGRVDEHADPGEDRPDLPEEDRPGFEPDMPYHPPPQPPLVPGDYYYPQPFVQAETAQPSSMQQFMPYQSSYEVGGSSQGGTQDLIDSMDRVGWTNFSSFFDGLDHFIPQQASPHTPTDLALALPRSDTEMQHAPTGRRSTSIGDTTGSALRPYDTMQMQGRWLSYTGSEASLDADEGYHGRPRRDTRAPPCGTGGRLGHEHH